MSIQPDDCIEINERQCLMFHDDVSHWTEIWDGDEHLFQIASQDTATLRIAINAYELGKTHGTLQGRREALDGVKKALGL